jgi:hypothetical protein
MSQASTAVPEDAARPFTLWSSKIVDAPIDACGFADG